MPEAEPPRQVGAQRLHAVTLGGMVSAGLIGLFVGAVVLALGYVIFMTWVAEGDADPCDPGAAEEGEMPLVSE